MNEGPAAAAARRANAPLGSGAPPEVARAAAAALSVADARALLFRAYARARRLRIALLSAKPTPWIPSEDAEKAVADAVGTLGGALAGRFEELELDLVGCEYDEPNLAQIAMEALAKTPAVSPPDGLRRLGLLDGGVVAEVDLRVGLGTVRRLEARVRLGADPLPSPRPEILEGRCTRPALLDPHVEAGVRVDGVLFAGGVFQRLDTGPLGADAARSIVSVLRPDRPPSAAFDVEFVAWHLRLGDGLRGLFGARSLRFEHGTLTAEGVEALADLAPTLERLDFQGHLWVDVDAARLVERLSRIQSVVLRDLGWYSTFTDPRLVTLLEAIDAGGPALHRRFEYAYRRNFYAGDEGVELACKQAARAYSLARKRALAAPPDGPRDPPPRGPERRRERCSG